MTEEFEEYWESLTQEQKEQIKEIIIARIKQTPDNWRLSIG